MSKVVSFVSSLRSGWLLFYGLILAAWAAMFAMAFTSTELQFTRIYGAEFWVSICGVDAGGAGFVRVFFMWLLMSAAMMAPTFVPSLRVFDDLTHTDATGRSGFTTLTAGYLAVWVGFSVLAGVLQIGLSNLGWMAGSRSIFVPLNATLLIGAGLYQFTPLKESCLSKCRAPLVFFMQHWEQGPLKLGLRLGLVCVGCCWALMLLGFVGGTMNLLWMGGATLLMVLEKLPQIGRYLTRPLGVIMIISGAAIALI